MTRFALLLLLTTACPAIEKDLLDTGDTAIDETTGTASTDPTSAGATTSEDATSEDATTADGTDSGGPESAAPMVLFSLDTLACMPYCARDLQPATPFTQPSCQMYELDEYGEPAVTMAKCLDAGDEWDIPAGFTRCYATLVDRGDPMSETYDQMRPDCVDAGSNVEFIVLLGENLPPGLLFGGVCEQSPQPQVDCPDL